MRAMGRPLAPSSLARPAAPGRPLRSGVSLASGGSTRSPRQQAAMRPAADTYRQADPSARRTRADVATRTHGGAIAAAGEQESMKRRRAQRVVRVGRRVGVLGLPGRHHQLGRGRLGGRAVVPRPARLHLPARAAGQHVPAPDRPARRPSASRRQSAPADGPRQHRAAAPAPRRRRAAPAPVDAAWDDDDDGFEPTPRQFRGARAQSAPAPARWRRAAVGSTTSAGTRRCGARPVPLPVAPRPPAPWLERGSSPVRHRLRRPVVHVPGAARGAPRAPERSASPARVVTRRLTDTTGTLRAGYGAVAQLVERNNRTVEARGSIPLSSTPSLAVARS